jgi:hypothetical protein
MKIKIKVNNDVPPQLNKKWVRNLLLIFASFMTIIALVQIVCLIVKPKGYEKVVFLLGDRYIEQLSFGLLCLYLYYMFKQAKRRET